MLSTEASRRVRAKGSGTTDNEIGNEVWDTGQRSSFRDVLMKGAASEDESETERDSEDSLSDDDGEDVMDQNIQGLDPADYVVGEKDGFPAISLSNANRW